MVGAKQTVNAAPQSSRFLQLDDHDLPVRIRTYRQVNRSHEGSVYDAAPLLERLYLQILASDGDHARTRGAHARLGLGSLLLLVGPAQELGGVGVGIGGADDAACHGQRQVAGPRPRRRG